MSNQFTDKVVMITGAGGNVARGVIKKFARAGAKLVLIDRDQEKLDNCIAALGDDLNEYMLDKADLGNVDEVNALVKRVEGRFKHIHVLAHTAGGFDMGKPVHEAGIDVWDKMMYLNARLTYITLGRVAKHMVDNGIQGALIGVLARSALKGSKNMAAYCASKAAAQRIIESMGAELLDHGINVNGVMPSIVDTPPNREAMPKADFSRWVTPDQIADAIYFLASEESIAITGSSLEVYYRS